jgi:NADH-quinone oxidoreductase subunit E
MSTPVIPENINHIVDKHRGKRGSIISILEDIQAEHSYLPREALEIVAQRTDHSLVDIYGVATFYRSFSLEPRGRHLVSVCVGTACHVRGAPKLLDAFEGALEVRAGQTTADREFTLTTVNCLGACALGPVAVGDGEYHPNLTSGRVEEVLHRCRCGNDSADVLGDRRLFQVKVSCPRCNYSMLDHGYKIDGKPSIRVLVSAGEKHGWLRMSSLYGSYNSVSEHEIPEHSVIHFFCHRCHAELRSTQDCTRCGAPMVPMLVRGGGVIHICSRRGCREHMLHLAPDNVE